MNKNLLTTVTFNFQSLTFKYPYPSTARMNFFHKIGIKVLSILIL